MGLLEAGPQIQKRAKKAAQLRGGSGPPRDETPQLSELTAKPKAHAGISVLHPGDVVVTVGETY
jgi:hypothetical protein